MYIIGTDSITYSNFSFWDNLIKTNVPQSWKMQPEILTLHLQTGIHWTSFPIVTNCDPSCSFTHLFSNSYRKLTLKRARPSLSTKIFNISKNIMASFYTPLKISEHEIFFDIFRVNRKWPSQLTFTCSKSTTQTLGKGNKICHWRISGVFILNFEHISHLFLVFLLLTLNK